MNVYGVNEAQGSRYFTTNHKSFLGRSTTTSPNTISHPALQYQRMQQWQSRLKNLFARQSY